MQHLYIALIVMWLVGAPLVDIVTGRAIALADRKEREMRAQRGMESLP